MLIGFAVEHSREMTDVLKALGLLRDNTSHS